MDNGNGGDEQDNFDYPDRLDEISSSLGRLYEALNGQETLEAVLARLADTTVRAVPDADVVTVTVLIDGQPQTIARTDERVSGLDRQQSNRDSGPHHDAEAQRRPVRTPFDEHTQQRWPEFADAASQAGVGASLSAPVYVDTDPDRDSHTGAGELLGMLNLYGDDPDAFDPFDESLLRLLTTAVSAAITAARRYERTREVADQLQNALDSRAPIEQAKGVLMAVHSIDADAAFQRLVRQSQQTHTPLHNVVRQLLESL